MSYGSQYQTPQQWHASMLQAHAQQRNRTIFQAAAGGAAHGGVNGLFVGAGVAAVALLASVAAPPMPLVLIPVLPVAPFMGLVAGASIGAAAGAVAGLVIHRREHRALDKIDLNRLSSLRQDYQSAYQSAYQEPRLETLRVKADHAKLTYQTKLQERKTTGVRQVIRAADVASARHNSQQAHKELSQAYEELSQAAFKATCAGVPSTEARALRAVLQVESLADKRQRAAAPAVRPPNPRCQVTQPIIVHGGPYL